MIDRSAADWSDGLTENFAQMLLTDVAASMQKYDADQSDPAKRDLIRTLFAAIEGFTRLYRDHVMEAARSIDSLTIEEESALAEISYQVTEQGKIVGQRRYHSMLATFRLATHIATRLSPGFAVEFGKGDWERLRSAVDVRNRITHPKHQADLAISEEDVSAVQRAFHWVLDTTTTAMEATNAAVRRHTADFQQILTELQEGNPSVWAEYRELRFKLDR